MLELNEVIMDDMEQIAQREIDFQWLKNRNVLISGANGLIASYLVNTMLYLNDTRDMGIQIYAMVRNREKAQKKWGAVLDRADMHLVLQDVTVPVTMTEHVDVIIHAASQTGPKQFVEDPVGTAMGNILGAYNLLEYGRANGVKKFLMLSTREIYGKGSLDYVTENDYGVVDPVNVRSCYPESKRMAENLCCCYRQQYGIDCKIARIAHTYGPGMLLSDGRVVGDFLGNVHRSEDIVMNSDGQGTLALTYISDVVAGLFYTLLNFEDVVYNISDSSETVTVKQLAEILCDTFKDRQIKLIMNIPKETKNASGYLDYKLGFLNSGKAIKEGWKPAVDLRSGMLRTIRSFEI